MPPKKILVVDDEDDIREIASISLDLTQGWELRTASSGAEAIEIARDFEPDAILLDVMMPVMDGPSTLRMLPPHIAVIFLTAKVQAADKHRFMQLGVRGIIAKPFDPLTLANQVAEMMQWGAESVEPRDESSDGGLDAQNPLAD